MAGHIPPVPLSTNIVDPKAKNPGALTPAWFNWFRSIWEIHNNAGHGNNLPFIGGVGSSASFFSGTLLNMSSGGTGTVQYRLVGRTVILYVTANIYGTFTGGGMALQGFPSSLSPANSQSGLCYPVANNGGIGLVGTWSIVANQINFTLLSGSPLTTTSFVAGGNTGLSAGWEIHYVLD